ncbi:MAG: hypothetical protein KZQ77_15485 [Candidatus Thiodiazotropha sp. (ex Notomyrtea botanica)]|nr:hypothetical protein [Candidatus Thiodiazotropha sp. (ex Notomyrtea botanica)]
MDGNDLTRQTELNGQPECPPPLLPENSLNTNPIATYLSSIFEESFIGKMSPNGFLCSTNWWPTD